MIRSLWVKVKYSMIDSVLAMMLACEIITPRGWPVDPDVNINDAGSCGYTMGNGVQVPANPERRLAKLTACWADEPGSSRSAIIKVREKRAACVTAKLD